MLRNHAKAVIACDFFVTVTATLRLLYVFVVIEHGTRRLAHLNATAYPGVEWALQQLREALAEDRHRYLIHDRDRIFAKQLDESIEALGVDGLRSPVASPKANAHAERFVRSIKEECLNRMIFVRQASLRRAEVHGSLSPRAHSSGAWESIALAAQGATAASGLVRRNVRLGGVLNYYYREAA